MTQGRKAPIKHAMTVDVEDYFHVAAFKDVIDPKDWDTWPCRVEKNTDNLLALFDQANIKITFLYWRGWQNATQRWLKEFKLRGMKLLRTATAIN